MAYKLKRENSENDKITQEQRDYIEIIKTNCDGIGRLAGFTKLTKLHHDWIFKMLTKQGIWVLQAHRGSFKSSSLCIAIALMMVLYPNQSIIFIRKTDEDVKEIVSKVSKVLKTDVFKRIVNVFHGCGLVFVKDSAFEITTNLKTDIGNGKAQLFAMGSSGSLTSKHADIVLVDDICFIAGTKVATPFGNRNIEDLKVGDLVLTTNGYEKVVRTSNREAEVITNVGLCGTPEHPVYSKIKQDYIPLKDITKEELVTLNDFTYTTKDFQGVATVYNIEVENTHNYYANGILVHNCTIKDRYSRVERERVKQVWHELVNNIKNPDGRVISIGTPWHVDDVFTLMPEPERYDCYQTGLLSDKEIKELKHSLPPSLFAANYELKHVSDEDRLFKDPKFTNEVEKIYGGICHIDAGYGGQDFTAFGILKRVDDHRYIAFGKRWQKHVNNCLDEIIRLKEKYKAGTLYLETNGDKGYLLKEIQKRNVKCSGYHESMNKHRKISTYLYEKWSDIEFIEATDEDYIGEILDYSENAEHDDCADDLSVLCKVLGRGKVKAITGLRI